VEPNADAQMSAKHSFVMKGHTRRVGWMQFTAMVLFLQLYHITLPEQPGVVFGFS